MRSVRSVIAVAATVLVTSGAVFAGCGGSDASEAKTPNGASTVTNSAIQTDKDGNTVSTSAAPPATGTGDGAGSADVAAGKTLFEGRCQTCHLNGGQQAGFGPKLAKFPGGLNAPTIETTVRKGRGAMPAWGGGAPYNDKDLATVVAYVLSLQ